MKIPVIEGEVSIWSVGVSLRLCRWISQKQDLINSEAMMKGVHDAKVLMLMTTSGIAEPERGWVHLEV